MGLGISWFCSKLAYHPAEPQIWKLSRGRGVPPCTYGFCPVRGVPQKQIQQGNLVREVAWKGGEGVKKIRKFCRLHMYMVWHQVGQLGWVDYGWRCFTILPSCTAISANFPRAQAEKTRWNNQILVNSTNCLTRCPSLYISHQSYWNLVPCDLFPVRGLLPGLRCLLVALRRPLKVLRSLRQSHGSSQKLV